MKKDPKNIEAFNELIGVYEGMTFEIIEDAWKKNRWGDGGSVAGDLTGFGTMDSCRLCIAIEADNQDDCRQCVYYRRRQHRYMFCCNTGKNQKTYSAIEESSTPEELLEAFKKRAKYLRKNYPEYVKIPCPENSVSK